MPLVNLTSMPQSTFLAPSSKAPKARALSVSVAASDAPRVQARSAVKTMRRIDRSYPPPLATIVVGRSLGTVTVVMGKVALVWPAGTFTEAGTVATLGEVLERVTTVPAGAAGLSRTTVPEPASPPVTRVGFRVS